MNMRLAASGHRGTRLVAWLAGGASLALLAFTAHAATTETSSGAAATPGAAPVAAASTETPAKPAAGSTGIPQVEYINELTRKSWADHKLVPSAPATDGEWCRRVYLDIIGRIPTVEELQKFIADKKPSKKADLVNRLLGDEYVEEYARNWTNIWTTLLIGRPMNKRDDARSPTNREGMQQYLRRSFEKNKHWDKMAYEMVSATGETKPGEPGYNGAVNFLIGKMNDNGKGPQDAVQATAKTAQLFLGMSVQCTQCHNHPFNDWKQNAFWEFNAFFRQTHMSEEKGAKKMVESAELTNIDFRGEGSDPTSAELYYELRNGILKAAYPVFVDGQQISRSGYLKDVDRRTELAKLITKSEYLGKSMVNRMWAHFLGYGFTKPVDDMGPHNPPSHPDLLDRLAKDFSASKYAEDGYDLKQLIRWIVLSEPYSLSSQYNAKNRSDDPTLGEKPQFSHFYLRQMSGEELYESMMIAALSEHVGYSDENEKAKEMWLSQFTINFGTDDGGESTTFNGSIPQALMMFNGEVMKRATSVDKGSLLGKVIASNMSIPEKVNYLYMAGLARKPTNAEGTYFTQLLTQRRDVSAIQDIWWAVLNSNEFILNH